MDTKVTVVIPTFNRANEIMKAIESVRKQTLKDWKVIIIDDGSTDNTEKVIKKILKKDDRFSFYKMPKNKGICHVLNKALELVQTEYMVQLDSDDWLEKKALEKLLCKMEENQNAALAYGNHKERRVGKKTILTKHREFRPESKYDLLHYQEMFYPRFYRTQCLRDVGGWEVNDKFKGRFMEDRRVVYKLIEKYEFVWVNHHLYNLRRFTQRRLTAQKNREKYRMLKRNLVKLTLKRWGDEYRAKFSLANNGKLKIKLIPTHSHKNP